MSVIKYRRLGRQGLQVSEITLGSMMFGAQTDDASAAWIVQDALEQGINALDTANSYNGGESERIVGKLIADQRSRWVLSSKFVNANPGGHGPNNRGASRHNVIESVEGSLRRLNTDYIDLYYVHREDPLTPIEETVRALGDLIRAGKIRAYGLSNHSSWKLAEFSRVADLLGVERPAASQPLYNLANRQLEAEHLPAAEHYGIGVVAYSPLARGVLTAKYDPVAPPGKDTRAGRSDVRLQQTEWRSESLNIAQRVKDHAQSCGITPGQFALAWVLNNRLISSAIAGPRTKEQWRDYVPALQYAFTAQDEAFVDSLVASGHNSTPGYTDPTYPVLGRKALT